MFILDGDTEITLENENKNHTQLYFTVVLSGLQMNINSWLTLLQFS